MTKRNIYIVEDDETLRSLVGRVLSGLPQVQVLEFHDAEHALAAFAEYPPAFVVADLGLPGMSGVEFIARGRQMAPKVPVIVTTGSRSRFQAELAQISFIEIWEKPFQIQDLRERLHVLLTSSEAAMFEPFGVVDYLRMAGFGRRDMVMEVMLEDGRQAKLEVVDGEVWSCQLDDLWGEPALRKVVLAETRHIDFSRLGDGSTVRTIETPTEQLLFEIGRLLDRDRGQ